MKDAKLSMKNLFRTAGFFLVAFTTIFALLFPFSQSFAGSVLKIDSDKQFGFAENYFSNKEYFRAIGEYKRFIYFFPEDARVEQAMYKIGMSYFKARHFKDAINSFKAIIDKYEDTDLSTRAYFMMSKCYVKLNEAGSAITNLHNLITIRDDIHVRDEAYYRIGWIYIEMASWEKARLYFGKISEQNKNKYRLKRLSAEIEKETSIPKKNPGLAGFLSIIPGAGFIYCERYQDALIAFLLNGGMICAAYESFDDDNNALGAIISFVELGFYAGNIYGAVNAAHKHNRAKTGQFIEKLKKNTKVRLSTGRRNDGIALCFQYVF